MLKRITLYILLFIIFISIIVGIIFAYKKYYLKKQDNSAVTQINQENFNNKNKIIKDQKKNVIFKKKEDQTLVKKGQEAFNIYKYGLQKGYYYRLYDNKIWYVYSNSNDNNDFSNNSYIAILLDNPDLKSFKGDSNYPIAKDNYAFWIKSYKNTAVDLNTIQIAPSMMGQIGNAFYFAGYFKDKYGYYYFDDLKGLIKLEGVSALESFYVDWAKSKQHIFYKDNIVSGLHPSSIRFYYQIIIADPTVHAVYCLPLGDQKLFNNPKHVFIGEYDSISNSKKDYSTTAITDGKKFYSIMPDCKKIDEFPNNKIKFIKETTIF